MGWRSRNRCIIGGVLLVACVLFAKEVTIIEALTTVSTTEIPATATSPTTVPAIPSPCAVKSLCGGFDCYFDGTIYECICGRGFFGRNCEASVSISGYTGPQTESSFLGLTCQVYGCDDKESLRYKWNFTAKGALLGLLVGDNQYLLIPNLSVNQAGEYQCAVYNKSGRNPEATTAIHVKIIESPDVVTAKVDKQTDDNDKNTTIAIAVGAVGVLAVGIIAVTMYWQKRLKKIERQLLPGKYAVGPKDEQQGENI